MRAPTNTQMLVGVRHPLGLGVSLLGLLVFLAFLLETQGEGSRTVHRADPKVDRILASSAPLIASDLAGFQERRRRQGLGYLRDTESLVSAWVAQFGAKDRDRMRDWTRHHGLYATATRSGFVIETSSAPGRDGWYRLTVDRRAGIVTSKCGGNPAPGCRAGRWQIESRGLNERYLLGR
jgi:hypothetical protein